MNLTRTIKDRSGKTLRTREDATHYVIAQLKVKPRYRSWIRAGEMIRDNEPVDALTGQIEFALFHQGAIDMKHWVQQLGQ